jgi:hypothetical protein
LTLSLDSAEKRHSTAVADCTHPNSPIVMTPSAM